MPLLHEAFVTLAGDTAVWDAEMDALKDKGGSLTDLQVSQSNRGYVPARLYQSIHGWYVRYASGLQGFDVLLDRRGLSRDEAIEWGKRWANESPKTRHFYSSKEDLERQDKWAK